MGLKNQKKQCGKGVNCKNPNCPFPHPPPPLSPPTTSSRAPVESTEPSSTINTTSSNSKSSSSPSSSIPIPISFRSKSSDQKIQRSAGGLPFSSYDYDLPFVMKTRAHLNIPTKRLVENPWKNMSIECNRCRHLFILTVGQQKWYYEKNFQAPKKCQECRDLRNF